ncbi:MAG: DUF1343 domain-containing protein [Lachnospiraceae bacterium]|nr:DUF1343 domain-containing protein [Lachnospiraceae bacterium]
MVICLLLLTLCGCASQKETGDSTQTGNEQELSQIVTDTEATDDTVGEGESVETAAGESEDGSSEAVSSQSDSGARPQSEEAVTEDDAILYGDEQEDAYLPLLTGKRVALFSNQTGIVGDRTRGEEQAADTSEAVGEGADLQPFGKNADGSDVIYAEHILDLLLERGVDVTVVFSPEHGFRNEADAGASVSDQVDEKTGVKIRSLYGSSKELTDGDVSSFDVLVIDLQDIGLRYYTYYLTMYDLMDACARAGRQIVLLDRPNPNGFYVDGPILQEGFHSGIGRLPLPVVHGMTLGELAKMINGEGWLSAGKDAADLTVIPCQNYSHKDKPFIAVRPSPNIKDMRAVYLYASTCFFENTAISVGRGTEYPFTIYGSPYLKGAAGYDASFTPVSMPGATDPPFRDQECFGKSLRQLSLSEVQSAGIDLRYLTEAYRAMQETAPEVSFFGKPDQKGRYWLDLLSGSDLLRKMIEEGKSPDQIKASWQEELAEFREKRKPYLLYEE